ncbi:hypothetical protein VTK56DRAFT_5675 [Thermocarpiscus australiensis]
MDSNAVKKAVIQQTLQATNIANARQLMEDLNTSCFERCIPKPGSSLSSGEKTCLANCMEKYMAAWSEVNAAYIRRIQQEMNNNSIANT